VSLNALIISQARCLFQARRGALSASQSPACRLPIAYIACYV